MASVDVAGCVAAVVSAFFSGADLVQALREKNEKKKKRKEKEIEQAHEEKMLHKALVDGARQIQLASVDRRQRLGSPFDVGDATATSDLKDIMISMQTEVISALQFARSVDNLPLDCSPLYEAVVTNKTAAVRAIDELCMRIMASMPTQRSLQERRLQSPAYAAQGSGYVPSNSPYRVGSDPTVQYRVSPSTIPQYMPGSSSRLPTHSRAKTQSTRQSFESPLQRMTSRFATADYPPVRGQGRSRTIKTVEVDDEDEPHLSPSLHDSAIENESVMRHRPTASVTSTDTVISNGSTESGAKRDELRIVQSAESRVSIASDDSTAADPSGTSTPAQFAAKMLQHLEFDDNYEAALRAHHAPEVVTKEFESLMLSPTIRQQRTPISPLQPFMPRPSLRPDSSYDVLAPEPDRLWSPLNRPARHNDYHNFCKGAWNTRENLQEGLAIAMIPNYKGQTVAHWKCKHCDFRSRGMNNSKNLPDQVYFSNSGVRYRWLFLAKSHVAANKPHSKPELYSYGCMFCAAQGRMTHVYENLDKMLEHVVGKHKTDMLTPEVLAKTRCIVGGAPQRSDDWDVNIPVSTRRIVTSDVKDFVVSAVTGIL